MRSRQPVPVAKVPETLGARLRRLREERGLAASELGRLAGVGENAIYKIESGASKQPSFATGVRIAAALGVDPTLLAFGGKAVPAPFAESNQYGRAPEVRALRVEVAELAADLGNLVALLTERLRTPSGVPPLHEALRERRAAKRRGSA